MSRNGWIACVIGVIVLLCACIFCLMLSLIGAASYLHISPTYSLNLPFQPQVVGSPTPSPVVIRPTPQKVISTPISPVAPTTPQNETATPGPESISSPVVVLTDTIHTLENTFIPFNDPIDLARRLLGLNALPSTTTPPVTVYKVGAQQSFWAGNGEEETFGLYARGLGDEIAGVFSSADEYPTLINQYSNGHELFQFNADNSPLGRKYTFGTLAHELQHMIHWYQDRNESNWLSEGFSELAVLLNNYYFGGFDAIYTSKPDLQLNNWPA